MVEFNERFREALEMRNKTMADVSRDTGINRSSLSEYMKGTYSPKQDRLHLIAKSLMVSPAWLLGFDVSVEGHATVQASTNGKTVPLVGNIAAGTPVLAAENIEEYYIVDESVPADFCLRVRGDSMIEEGISDGDIVFIKQQPVLENGEIGAVIINEEATLKRVFKENRSLILQPGNNKYKPIIITEGDVLIAGKLVGLYRDIED